MGLMGWEKVSGRVIAVVVVAVGTNINENESKACYNDVLLRRMITNEGISYTSISLLRTCICANTTPRSVLC